MIASNLPGDITTLGGQISGTEQEIVGGGLYQFISGAPSLEDMKANLLALANNTSDKGLANALEEIAGTF